MKKKILIITEGGKDFGLGHIVRCKALYDAISSQDCDVEFLINGDTSIVSLLENSKVTFIDWHNNQQDLKKISKAFDLCIIDSYYISETICLEIAKEAQKLIVFDDTNRIMYPEHTIVINGLLDINESFYKNQHKIDLLLGIKYQCIRNIFNQKAPKLISQELNNVLITVGGNDIRNILPKIVSKISTKFSFNIHVIVSNSTNNLNEIKLLESEKTKIYISPTENEIIEIYNKTDFAISAAGQTVCELAILNTPGVLLSVIDNQYNHAISWSQRGCFDFIGNWDDKDLIDKLNNSLSDNMDKYKRQHKIIQMNKIIDGEGAHRVISYILNH